MMRETVNLNNNLGHLFGADIEFDAARADAKTLIYNELCTPIFEKDRVLDPSKRSVFQLFENLNKGSEDNILTYKCTKKPHATMVEKKFIPLYLEHLAVW